MPKVVDVEALKLFLYNLMYFTPDEAFHTHYPKLPTHSF